ncbi:unnamed protein product [Darwinula stevensoni]|uniref:Nose resistant-to-fluoxetine protein N-terminal domain-containing protein n=1 Tax=Darwinula stevensoni TaxID=69355 RepID=A0A7R8XA07_9CRUS|nr:unnamed protein product [Darwinula stevensoni]CAG0883124.1 unnamed protein product [Darwinula stevensoni]
MGWKGGCVGILVFCLAAGGVQAKLHHPELLPIALGGRNPDLVPGPPSRISPETLFAQKSLIRSRILREWEGILRRVPQLKQGPGDFLDALNSIQDPQCRAHFTFYLFALLPFLPSVAEDDDILWALSMLDATGKIPEGILEGNLFEWGNWDQCLAIKVSLNESTLPEGIQGNFTGKYCLTNLIFMDPAQRELQMRAIRPKPRTGGLGEMASLLGALPPAIGVCVPSSCSHQDLSNFLMGILPMLGLSDVPIIPYMDEKSCHAEPYNEEERGTKFTRADIIVACVVMAFIIMAACGTILDLSMQNDPDRFKEIRKDKRVIALISFSVYTNGKKVLNTSSTADTLGFLSMTWVVMGHIYGFSFAPQWRNLGTAFEQMFSDWRFMAIANATVSVDTFFFLSGLLVAYILLRDLKRSKGRFNPILYYLHRFIRLTPTLAIAVALLATLSRHMGNGPVWSTAELQAEVCQEDWWRTILYVSNIKIDGRFGQCLGQDSRQHIPTIALQAWYLACDMQMYWFSPFLVVPLFFVPFTVGLGYLVIAMIFFGYVGPFINHYIHEFPATLIPTAMLNDPEGNFFAKAYMVAYVRAGPYVVGIIMGYILHHSKGKKIKMSLPTVALGWGVATATALAIIYGLTEQFKLDGEQLSVTANAFYGGFHRTAWATCVAWVVFACVNGYGGTLHLPF